jgi:hypothetical protein
LVTHFKDIPTAINAIHGFKLAPLNTYDFIEEVKQLNPQADLILKALELSGFLSFKRVIDYLNTKKEKLSDWEQKFVSDRAKDIEANKLSEKQFNSLKLIINKVRIA